MPALTLRKLTKRYANGFEALKGLDLEVQSGDFFALLGPNGAGKSTTIGIISSLINKTSGTVRVFGYDLDHQREAAKRCIGLVPQEINFNQFETARNILINQAGYYGIPRREAKRRAQICLEQVNLWDQRDQVSRQLSGGMKRRLMIARALVHSPRLLILDEPTAGVDIETRHLMWGFIQRINREGTTIILTTHYLEEAENLCRTIAIINQGRIVEYSAMASLLARIQVNRFILELRQPLTTLPELTGYALRRIDDLTLEAEVPTESGIQGLFHALASHGVEVIGLRNASNRLEQLFIHLLQSQNHHAIEDR